MEEITDGKMKYIANIIKGSMNLEKLQKHILFSLHLVVLRPGITLECYVMILINNLYI